MTQHPPASARPAPDPASGAAPFAGLERRFAAFLVDHAVVAILIGAATRLLTPFLGQAGGIPLTTFPMVLTGWQGAVGITIVWLYHAGGESSAWQSTPGKRMLGLRVVGVRGGRIGFGRATTRFVMSILSSAFCWMGYLIAAFDGENATFHDAVAGTRVVRP